MRAGLQIHRAFGVVARRAGQLLQNLAVVGGQIDFVGRIDGPHVAFAAIGRGRAGVARLHAWTRR